MLPFGAGAAPPRVLLDRALKLQSYTASTPPLSVEAVNVGRRGSSIDRLRGVAGSGAVGARGRVARERFVALLVARPAALCSKGPPVVSLPASARCPGLRAGRAPPARIARRYDIEAAGLPLRGASIDRGIARRRARIITACRHRARSASSPPPISEPRVGSADGRDRRHPFRRRRPRC
jgi:hypothetical protein